MIFSSKISWARLELFSFDKYYFLLQVIIKKLKFCFNREIFWEQSASFTLKCETEVHLKFLWKFLLFFPPLFLQYVHFALNWLSGIQKFKNIENLYALHKTFICTGVLVKIFLYKAFSVWFLKILNHFLFLKIFTIFFEFLNHWTFCTVRIIKQSFWKILFCSLQKDFFLILSLYQSLTKSLEEKNRWILPWATYRLNVLNINIKLFYCTTSRSLWVWFNVWRCKISKN